MRIKVTVIMADCPDFRLPNAYCMHCGKSHERRSCGPSAEDYAEAAHIALAGSGIITPEKGYIGDGGPGSMAAAIVDLRRDRDRWRRAATVLAAHMQENKP